MRVYTRTRYGAAKIARVVSAVGHHAAEIHGNRSLGQRRDALEGFKSGKYRVLIATDIASRGIDVVGIELVLNFDLPEQPEDYVHRIGRTARMGKEGHAISFATPDQRKEVEAIERLIQKRLPISKLPDFPVPQAPAKPAGAPPRPPLPPRRPGRMFSSRRHFRRF